MKHIALCTLNKGRALQWASVHYEHELEQIRYSHGLMYLKGGAIVHIVNDPREVIGLEINEMVLAPDYTDLRLECEKRIARTKWREDDK